MSEKEPGQIAWEAYSVRVQTLTGLVWGQIAQDRKAQWAAVETAVRNAALEEAARIADEAGDNAGSADTVRQSYLVADTIRALKRKEAPDAS